MRLRKRPILRHYTSDPIENRTLEISSPLMSPDYLYNSAMFNERFVCCCITRTGDSPLKLRGTIRQTFSQRLRKASAMGLFAILS